MKKITGWRRYNSFILPSSPPHVELKVNKITLLLRVIFYSATFARWHSDFDMANKSDFYFIIKDKFSPLESYPYKIRREIKRGLDNFYVELINPEISYTELYNVYKNAVGSYSNFHKGVSFREFQKNLENDLVNKNLEIVGIFTKHKGELVGYSINIIDDNQVEISNVKLSPEFLRMGTGYLIFYKMNEIYLSNNKYEYLNDGAKSFLHDSGVQDYLIRVHGFRRAYAKLNVIYHPVVWVAVKFLYPFKSILRSLPYLIFRKFSGLLRQEEVLRKSRENG